MWETLSDLEHDKFGFKTIFHIIVGLLIFIISQLTASLIVDFFYMFTKLEWSTFYVALRCLFEISFFYLFIRLYIYKALKLNLSYFRITKPRFSFVWVLIAFLLPSTVILYYLTFTKGTISYGNGASILLNIAHALKLGLSAGINEELLFRGFIMKLVENRWNKKVAIFVPSIIFASLHLTKGMGSTDVVLLFIAGITVGIMFSLVTYHNESIYNAVILHTVWNTLIIGIFSISSKNDYRALVNYVIESDNILITGGRFGVEGAIPAIVGYIIVIIITFVLKHNNQKR